MIGAAVMILGGVVAIFCGVDAEGKSLEDVATPLSVVAQTARNHLPLRRRTRGHRPDGRNR